MSLRTSYNDTREAEGDADTCMYFVVAYPAATHDTGKGTAAFVGDYPKYKTLHGKRGGVERRQLGGMKMNLGTG